MKHKYIKPASTMVYLQTEDTLMLTSVTGNTSSDATTDDDQTISWSQHGIWNGSASSDKNIWDSDK